MDDRQSLPHCQFATARIITGVAVAVVLAAVGCTSAPRAAAPAAPAAATTPAPTPTATPAPTPLTLTASVTRQHPFVGTKVGVVVSTLPGARVRAVAQFQAGIRDKTARADVSGLHTFWYLLSSAMAGYRVRVDVRVLAHGQKRSSRTWFTPRPRPPPPPPKPAPAPAHNSGAWCTASAVYNAQCTPTSPIRRQ
jgi:hypothetical protein